MSTIDLRDVTTPEEAERRVRKGLAFAKRIRKAAEGLQVDLGAKTPITRRLCKRPLGGPDDGGNHP